MLRILASLFATLFTAPCFGSIVVTQDFIHPSKGLKSVEYFWAKPDGLGPFPLLLLIHPDQDSPKNGGKAFVDSGQVEFWTKQGYLTVAISQPGYGNSTGPSDFCGPITQQATIDLIHYFKSKSSLVSNRIFVYGGSRGASVASVVAALEPSLSGIILKSGVYDFIEWSKSRPWYDPIKLQMLWEVGWLSDNKLKERSAIYLAEKIRTPILIIHGSRDQRAPVKLAVKFAQAIHRAMGNARVLKMDSEHVIPMALIEDPMVAFMNQH